MDNKYKTKGTEIGALVDKKQAAYGGIERVHAAMKIFYPDGIPVDKLKDALLIVRTLDKINRISGGDKAAFGEDPWRDIAGYGLLGIGQATGESQQQHISKNCSNCHWGSVSGVACWSNRVCYDFDRWKPRQDQKECHECKHYSSTEPHSPCRCCDGLNEWEA